MIGLLVLCLTLFGQSEPAGQASLLVRFEGMPDAQAPVVAALFASAETFDSRSGAVRSVQLLVGEGDVLWQIDGLPLSDYGLLAYQDLNRNGEFDLDKRGRPLEPYTTSGKVRKRAPRFRSAVFALTEPNTEITLADWRYRKPRP